MTKPIKMVIPAALVLAAVLALSSLVHAGSRQEYTYPEEETFSLDQGALITISNTRGSIDIQGGDGEQVMVRFTKRVKARSRLEAKEWAEKVEILIDRDDRELFIEAKLPREWTESLGSLIKGLFDKRPSVRVDFEIFTPRQMEIEVASVSGDVLIRAIDGNTGVDVVSGDLEIEEIEGDVRIDNVSGDMVVQSITGVLNIDAVSGDADISDVDGSLSIDLTSGDVYGKRLRGNVAVDATSGDVVLREVSGDVRIDLTSGDITLQQERGELWIDTSSGDVSVETVVEIDGRYEVDTSSGEIVFRIPENSSSSVDLETSGGRIHAKLPMVVESVSRTHLQGTIGSGGAEIVLSTSGGDIELLPVK